LKKTTTTTEKVGNTEIYADFPLIFSDKGIDLGVQMKLRCTVHLVLKSAEPLHYRSAFQFPDFKQSNRLTPSLVVLHQQTVNNCLAIRFLKNIDICYS
jgi:hypothetical protein